MNIERDKTNVIMKMDVKIFVFFTFLFPAFAFLYE